MFELKNQYIKHQNLTALRQINLKVKSGEKVALVGPSGAGKTTLLQTLYQIRPQDCAFVQQHFALVPQLSVFYNVYMGRLDYHGMFFNLINLIKPRKKIVAKVLSILKTVGIEEDLFVKVGVLSDGQQQRVAVARAIYRGSRILLADEPIAAIDPSQAEALLETIFDTDKTVVIALHSVELTLKYAQRIIGLCDGAIRFDLPCDQVTPDHITDLYISC